MKKHRHFSKHPPFRGFGILNKNGGWWTSNTFASIGEAQDFMAVFWKGVKNPPDMSKHKIIPVEIRILPNTNEELL